MLIIPLDAGPSLRSKQGSQKLRLLLSFAVGGLLGKYKYSISPSPVTTDIKTLKSVRRQVTLIVTVLKLSII